MPLQTDPAADPATAATAPRSDRMQQYLPETPRSRPTPEIAAQFLPPATPSQTPSARQSLLTHAPQTDSTAAHIAPPQRAQPARSRSQSTQRAPFSLHLRPTTKRPRAANRQPWPDLPTPTRKESEASPDSAADAVRPAPWQ